MIWLTRPRPSAHAWRKAHGAVCLGLLLVAGCSSWTSTPGGAIPTVASVRLPASPSATRVTSLLASTGTAVIPDLGATPRVIDDQAMGDLEILAEWDPWDVNDMTWSVDSRHFAVAMTAKESGSEGVLLYDAPEVQEGWYVESPPEWAFTPDIEFSPDGRSLVAAEFTRGIRWIDVDTGSMVKTLECTHGHALSLSADGRLVAVGSSYEDMESHDLSQIGVADIDRGECFLSLSYDGWLGGLAMRPDGGSVTAQFETDDNEMVVSWDVPLGKQLCKFPGWPPYYSPDGTMLVVPSLIDGTTEVRTSTDCTILNELEGQGYPHGFDAEGYLVLSDETALRLWDLSSNRQVAQLERFPIEKAWNVPSPDWRYVLTFERRVDAAHNGRLMLLGMNH